jgi:hypothetical protein
MSAYRRCGARRAIICQYCHLSSVICHVVNGLADLDVLDYGGAEMIAFFAPGIGVSANTIRAVEPA